MRNRPSYTDNDIDEDMKLTRSDYIKILHHYQPHTYASTSSISTKTAKERAHRILAEKLCSCIKPVSSDVKSGSNDEGRRIAYCTQSIFNNKGLRRHGFRCKTAKRRRSLRPRLMGDITKTTRKLHL
jgi:hypothetical protein